MKQGPKWLCLLQKLRVWIEDDDEAVWYIVAEPLVPLLSLPLFDSSASCRQYRKPSHHLNTRSLFTNQICCYLLIWLPWSISLRVWSRPPRIFLLLLETQHSLTPTIHQTRYLVMHGVGYETQQVFLFHVFVCIFGLDSAQENITNKIFQLNYV